PLLHTWSLGVEEQFYLIWPLLLILIHKVWGLRRSPVILGILFILSLLAREYLVRTNAMDAFYLPWSRAWQLSLGGMVSLAVLPAIQGKKGVEFFSALGVFLILFSLLFLDEKGMPGFKALVPCLGAALFIHAARQETGLAHTILSSRIMVFTGLISYSLYLWHWPLVAFYKGYFSAELDVQARIAIIIVSFILACVSWRYIEQPARRLKISPRKIISAGVCTIMVFILASNVLKLRHSAAWRVSYEMDRAELRPHDLYDICAGEGGAFDRQNCIIGPNKDTYEVIVSGDSHAAHYMPTVVEWAKSRDLTVRMFSRRACSTWVESSEVKMKAGKPDTYCMDLTKAFYDVLEKDTSIRYVFLGLRLAGDSEDLRRSLKKIKSANRAVYYLGSVPEFREDPHDCMIRNHVLVSKWFPREGKDCMTLDPGYARRVVQGSHASLLPLLKSLDIPYFDPLPLIKVPRNEDGQFIYMDNHHLNQYGALYLVPGLKSFIEKNG
nr:acyltransferase [Pseudomonadota bacterium]